MKAPWPVRPMARASKMMQMSDLVALTETVRFGFVRHNAVLQRSTHHVCITGRVDVFLLF
jgi:hypothetical protein